MKQPLTVTVPSYAKLNLDLRVLARRPDGFHELRTIFQTISLHDSLTIEFCPARHTEIELVSSVEIDDNIIVRAARAVLEYMEINASVRFKLTKRIPLGAGLGGGSSNAASVLAALPALARKPLDVAQLQRLASWLGSDVPFFLYGGIAMALGRGTELYPLPDLPAHSAVVLPSGIHVSTAEAYRNLLRPALAPEAASNVTDSLTSPVASPMLGEFQAVVWSIGRVPLAEIPLQNDFEGGVFAKHPELAGNLRKLRRSGGRPARMTGSGSAVWGVFDSAEQARHAAERIPGALVVRFLTRRAYRTLWRQALAGSASFSTPFKSELRNPKEQGS